MPVTHAITVRQPLAQIMAESAALTALGVVPKLVDNRGQMVAAKHIGTDIAIHASQAWDYGGARDERVRKAWTSFATAINMREVNPKLAAIGDTRTGFVGRLRPGLWCELGAVVAVATLVDCHQAKTPCPNACTAPGGVPRDLEYSRDDGCWCCDCGYSTGWVAGTCCQPWGERLHGERRARHLVFANVRRLGTLIYAAGKQMVPWLLDPMTATDVNHAVAAVSAHAAGGAR